MQAVRLSVCARSDVGRVRQNNEDSFAVSDLETGSRLDTPATVEVRDRGVLMVVSDGMGGHAAGEVASALVVDSLGTALADPAVDHSSMQRILDAAVQRANANVWQAARDARKKGMGATLTAVLVHDADAYVAEVGDSRVYLLRSGRIRQITKDQSFVQMLLDAGVLTPEQAKDAPQKNVILQAMGLEPNVQVSIGRLGLRRGDRLLLCCDGISNKITDEELRGLLAEPDLEAACSRMIDLANERGGDDNLTTVIAHVDGEGLPEARPEEPVTQTLEVLQEFGGGIKKNSPPRDPASLPASGSTSDLQSQPKTSPPPETRPRVETNSAIKMSLALAVAGILVVLVVLGWWLLRQDGPR